MKKFFIPILSLFLIVACGNKTENSTNTSESDTAVEAETAESADGAANGVASNQTKEGAKAFVEEVYKTYLNPSEEDVNTLDDAEITIFGMSYMGKYMSDNLQEKIVEAYDKQNAEDDLFLDYDIWTNSQDDTGMKLKEVSVVEFTGETATLEVVLTLEGNENKVYPIVEYNKEKNCWLVSDFLDASGKKFLGEIEEYLK